MKVEVERPPSPVLKVEIKPVEMRPSVDVSERLMWLSESNSKRLEKERQAYEEIVTGMKKLEEEMRPIHEEYEEATAGARRVRDEKLVPYQRKKQQLHREYTDAIESMRELRQLIKEAENDIIQSVPVGFKAESKGEKCAVSLTSEKKTSITVTLLKQLAEEGQLPLEEVELILGRAAKVSPVIKTKLDKGEKDDYFQKALSVVESWSL